MPAFAVVVLVAPDRIELANRVVLAGARAVLAKPLEPRSLQQTLTELLSGRGARSLDRKAEPSGRVIAVVGPRGGVGRTSLACNLAVSLAGLDETVWCW